MSTQPSTGGISEHDFETIEDAVMETARGRWFLREYARRMRSADTNRLLDALSRIERAMTGQAAGFTPGARVSFELSSLEERRDRLADLATSLREQGYDGDLCGRIEREALGLADVVEDLRTNLGAQGEAADMPSIPAPRSSEMLVANEDPHAAAPLTIEAEVLPPPEPQPAAEDPPAPRPDAAQQQLPAPRTVPDMGALAAIDSMPFRDKLAMFS